MSRVTIENRLIIVYNSEQFHRYNLAFRRRLAHEDNYLLNK